MLLGGVPSVALRSTECCMAKYGVLYGGVWSFVLWSMQCCTTEYGVLYAGVLYEVWNVVSRSVVRSTECCMEYGVL